MIYLIYAYLPTGACLSFLRQMILDLCLPSDWDLSFFPPPDDGRLRIAVDVTSEFYVFARQNSLVRRLLSELRPDGGKTRSGVSYPASSPCRLALPSRPPVPPCRLLAVFSNSSQGSGARRTFKSLYIHTRSNGQPTTPAILFGIPLEVFPHLYIIIMTKIN